MSSIVFVLLLLANVVFWVVIAHVVMSWLINFQVLNLNQPFVKKLWDGLNLVLNPVYSRIRSFLPNTSPLDFAPLVVIVGVYIVRYILSWAYYAVS